MSSLYDRIDMLCKNNRISVTTLCKETGVSRASLSDLKSGRSKNLSVGAIKKISAHFNAPISFLIGEQPFQYWDEMIKDKDMFASALIKATGKSPEFIAALYGSASDISDYNLMRLVSDEIESATPLLDSWVIKVEDLEMPSQKNQEVPAATENLSDIKSKFIESVMEMTDEQIILLQAVVDQVLRENGLQ